MNNIPVTVLAGTDRDHGHRILETILANAPGHRIAAIVPKRRSRKTTVGERLFQTRPRTVQVGNGCSCCFVRDDIMTKVRRITTEKSADHIVIVEEPGSDLETLAKTFTVANDSGTVLSDVAYIEGMVIVIRAGCLLSTLGAPSVRSLVDRIEFANVIVVEGMAALKIDEVERILLTLQLLNPNAQITRSDLPELTLATLRATQLFELSEERSVTEHDLQSPSAEQAGPGVRFTYTTPRPFHPERLYAWIHETHPGLVRATGAFWIASRPTVVARLDIACGSSTTRADAVWWASVSPERRPNTPEFHQFVNEWHPAFGDRRQQIHISGIALDVAGMKKQLDACTLTEQEISTPEVWSTYPDPFQWTGNSK